MNAGTLGKMAEKSQVKKLIVTHLYPPALQVDIYSQIRKYYPGPLIIASDGEKILLEENWTNGE